MTTAEVRERFIEFFVARDHRRVPSGSLVPADYDPSVLLTTAGMHPLKPYFLGREAPPGGRRGANAFPHSSQVAGQAGRCAICGTVGFPFRLTSTRVEVVRQMGLPFGAP